jgi:abortive infection bacteriophage resistance protein
MQFNKPALSIAEQISLLRSRGLIIGDEILATYFLTNVSYYRLEGYWWPLQSDKVNHIFKPESHFQTVIDLYNFDRELRLLLFEMIERIEIGLRTRLIYQLSLSHSPFWFEDFTVFSNKFWWEGHLRSLDDELSRSKEIFIKEHFRKYANDSRRPPAWKSLEVISFGLLSKLYQNLDSKIAAKDRIAADLGAANHTFLTSWLLSMSVTRNICAHHARIWNRHLPVTPKLLKYAPNPWLNTFPVQQNTIYVVLCCMRYLLFTISPENQFHQKIADLIGRYPNVDIHALGFTRDWQSQPLWK